MEKRLEGRDYVRELVRIRDKHTCQEKGCGKKWKEGTRRFDVHHTNGQCGKKSRKYDRKSDMGGLTTLCHACHIGKHVSKHKFTKHGVLKHLGEHIDHLRDVEGLTYDAIGARLGVSGAAIGQNRKRRQVA